MEKDCEERFEELETRKEKFQSKDCVQRKIPDDCKIYRAIKKTDKKVPARPDPGCFSDKGLSVIIAGPDLPEVNLEKEFERWKEKGYVGVWEIPKESLPADEYIYSHDPFPYYDKDGKECAQPCKNHAHIFCHKPQAKGKTIAKDGQWKIHPVDNESSKNSSATSDEIIQTDA